MGVGKVSRLLNLMSNMGGRYICFRLGRELTTRTGLLQKRFPEQPAEQTYLTLAQWKAQQTAFFFASREELQIPRHPDPALEERYTRIRKGEFLLFQSQWVTLGRDYDWVTNPDSGYRYPHNLHWTRIADFSPTAGDIKYVWEKSRFSYLADIIRYDHHYSTDCADFVFAEILSWIAHNPVNCGPNYRCSQEMSLRILNWTFALHYYRNSPALTEAVFHKFQYALYWHIRHIHDNIQFSRIAVRNNHAITETLCLYLTGLLYPTLPDAARYKALGKQWFEEEIAYQIYEDGTFLQFSMNYHRVVVQLLTWALTLARSNGEQFAPVVEDRARKSLRFLSTCMVDENGQLPNYGNNDGALFFRFSEAHFRDYRPQLDALAAALDVDLNFAGPAEERQWYGLPRGRQLWEPEPGCHTFAIGGYYVVREPDTLTFLRCGSHKDRPHQADNLHLDVWYRGENLLPDAGTYKYNTDEQTIRYFGGSRSHNTVMLGGLDQMLRGGRFIWYFWSQCVAASLKATGDGFTFTGQIRAFRQSGAWRMVRRTVVKTAGKPEWKITDELLTPAPGLTLSQHWHFLPAHTGHLTFRATDGSGTDLEAIAEDGWYSSLYGLREKAGECYFCTPGNQITTTIVVD
jgi:Heparinase II/III-like protein/Heparinase II/III N-terminus